MIHELSLCSLKKAHTLSIALIEGTNLDQLIKQYDGYIKKTLLFLRDNKAAKLLLKRFTLPIINPYIEELIRASTKLPNTNMLTNNHIKQAVLSALLFPLRQIVGSCFATAPAIYIQNEQKERFLNDLYDLITLCQLKRTLSGKEYIVPISLCWRGKQIDHPLLRVWEYTLASFSDYKVEFSRWNFYESLGLNPKEKNGLGELLYKTVQKKLDGINHKLEIYHQDYCNALDKVHLSQALLRQADTTSRIQMRRAELKTHALHAHACQELYDNAHTYAKQLSSLFSFLIQKYTELFQEHFLEIFDADIMQVNPALYEDSPAGFRLVYKHGRTNPLAWSLIYNAKEYVLALSQFFVAVEPTLTAECEWQEGTKEIQDLTTHIAHYLQTQDFLSFATKKRNPWSYISGGNMEKLLQCYYGIEGTITKEERTIKSAMDLLIFLLDLMKALPYSISKRFEEDDTRSLLMYSPMHAFLFKPGLRPFILGWLDKGFTYTWVRDNILSPGQRAYATHFVDQKRQMKIGIKLMGHAFSPHKDPLNILDFCAFLLEQAPDKEEIIVALLFNNLYHPDPLLFADTNWLNYFFAFAVNPATLELDLYRYDPLTKKGFPMTIWENKWDDTWGVFTQPKDLCDNHLPDLAYRLKKV